MKMYAAIIIIGIIAEALLVLNEIGKALKARDAFEESKDVGFDEKA